MDELVCLIKGHKPKITVMKRQRMTRWGEKSPQYEIYENVTCERCGKWQHPYRMDWVGQV